MGRRLFHEVQRAGAEKKKKKKKKKIGADEADPGDSVASFAFRQSDSSDNEGILVDNLAITQTFAETLSNEEFTLANGFKVYPNPTSLGFVNIASANNAAISVAVFDVLGKQVLNETLNNNRLNVSTLNSGVYIMKGLKIMLQL